MYISRDLNESPRSPAGALFIGDPKLSRSAQRRKNPERPENSAGKFSTLASLSLALVSFPSRAWRLPVYFQRGLFNSNRQPARLAKSVLARKKKRERERRRESDSDAVVDQIVRSHTLDKANAWSKIASITKKKSNSLREIGFSRVFRKLTSAQMYSEW